ncbi:SRPBCC domain-containing protein [Micromonospora sp. NPDC048999]|uniref:SRPBCC family protein n=1 Tax=Micromonospora sp. NPDC048999 TaxID=3155391 RepID=UPI0033C9A44D
MSTLTETRRGFTIVRRLDAPRELVFQAWTDPEHLHWFIDTETAGSRHETTVDLKTGGAWRLHMIENEERQYTTGGVYRQVVPPEKLVFTWGAVDGWPPVGVDSSDDNPVVTVTLKDVDGATEMTLDVGFDDHVSDEAVRSWLTKGIANGWTATVDRLGPYLAGLAAR